MVALSPLRGYCHLSCEFKNDNIFLLAFLNNFVAIYKLNSDS